MSDVYLIQPATLEAIADAIRGKTGETARLTPAQMADEVEGLTKVIEGTSDLEAGVSALPAGVVYFYRGNA